MRVITKPKRQRSGKVSLRCEGCKRSYSVSPWQAKSRSYCSPACFRKSTHGAFRKYGSPNKLVQPSRIRNYTDQIMDQVNYTQMVRGWDQ